MDEWKDIDGFEGYQINRGGSVRTCRRRRWGGFTSDWRPMKLSVGTTNRLKVTLRSSEGKVTKDIHRMLLEVFVGPPPEEGMFACHRDDNPFNNDLANLYWGTPKSNGGDRKRNGKNADKRGEKHHMAKLTEQQVRDIREAADGGQTHSSIAPRFGVTRECVSRIARRVGWSHLV